MFLIRDLYNQHSFSIQKYIAKIDVIIFVWERIFELFLKNAYFKI
jgi:hypothetical protein